MTMDLPGTITRCIRDLEAGEGPGETTPCELWEHFFADMMLYARRRLGRCMLRWALPTRRMPLRTPS